MKKFQELLNKQWTKSQNHNNKIYGFCGEDNHAYDILVPPQFVDQIVAMQNYVFDLNKQVTDMEENIRTLQTQLDIFKQTRGYE